MSVFDFFLSNDKKTQTKTLPREDKFNFSNSQNEGGVSSGAMNVIIPKSFDDVAKIIDVLVLGKPAIVKIKDLQAADAQRVIDFLSGAIYALHGGVYTLDKDNALYLFSINGVDVK